MNEVEFKNWLSLKNTNNKVISDTISRLKRIEKELDFCDFDEEYKKDKCNYIKSLFLNNGNNDEMKKFSNASFPFGKYYMSTYRSAINKYIEFKDFLKQNRL